MRREADAEAPARDVRPLPATEVAASSFRSATVSASVCASSTSLVAATAASAAASTAAVSPEMCAGTAAALMARELEALVRVPSVAASVSPDTDSAAPAAALKRAPAATDGSSGPRISSGCGSYIMGAFWYMACALANCRCMSSRSICCRAVLRPSDVQALGKGGKGAGSRAM